MQSGKILVKLSIQHNLKSFELFAMQKHNHLLQVAAELHHFVNEP